VIGAADQNWRGLVIIDGFGDLPRTAPQFARRWRPRYGVFAEALAWLAQRAAMLLIDCPNRRLCATAAAGPRVYMINAEDDEFVPHDRARR